MTVSNTNRRRLDTGLGVELIPPAYFEDATSADLSHQISRLVRIMDAQEELEMDTICEQGEVYREQSAYSENEFHRTMHQLAEDIHDIREVTAHYGWLLAQTVKRVYNIDDSPY